MLPIRFIQQPSGAERFPDPDAFADGAKLWSNHDLTFFSDSFQFALVQLAQDLIRDQDTSFSDLYGNRFLHLLSLLST